MFVSVLASLVMFAAPDSAQAGPTPAAPPADAAKAKPRRVCQTVPSSESRLPRKVCVMQVPAADAKAETAAAQPSPEAPKPE